MNTVTPKAEVDLKARFLAHRPLREKLAILVSCLEGGGETMQTHLSA